MQIIIKDDWKVIEQREIDAELFFRWIEKEIAIIDAKIERAKVETEKLKERRKELFQKMNEKEKLQEIQENRKKKIIWNVTDWWKNKVYHLPSDEWYDSVEFDKERGDMLFKTEADAISAWFVAKEKNTEKLETKETTEESEKDAKKIVN